MKHTNILLSVAFLIQSPARADAPPKRPITPADLWKVARVGPPSIAPDGKWCVVEVTRYDIDKDDSGSDLWLLSTDGQTQKQLTSAGGKSSNRCEDRCETCVRDPEGAE